MISNKLISRYESNIQDPQSQDTCNRNLCVEVHLNIPEKWNWPVPRLAIVRAVVNFDQHESSGPICKNIDRRAEVVDVLQVYRSLTISTFGHQLGLPCCSATRQHHRLVFT